MPRYSLFLFCHLSLLFSEPFGPVVCCLTFLAGYSQALLQIVPLSYHSPILLALPPGSGHTCCVCPTCWDSLCCFFRLLCFSVFEDCPDKASPTKILFSAVSTLLTCPAKALFISLPVVFIRSIIFSLGTRTSVLAGRLCWPIQPLAQRSRFSIPSPLIAASPPRSLGRCSVSFTCRFAVRMLCHWVLMAGHGVLGKKNGN